MEQQSVRTSKKTPPTSAQNPIRSAERTVNLLIELKDNDGATISELADSLGYSKAAVSNYMSTLQDQGLVTELDTGGYDVGLRLLDICNKSIHSRPLLTQGKDVVDDLATRFDGVITIMTVEHGYGYCLYTNTTEDIISKERLSQGTRRYLHCNGPGQAILAYMDEREIDEVVDAYGLQDCDSGCEFDCPLAKYAKEMPRDRESLDERLEIVREQGYSVTNHGQISCMGTPIFNSRDEIIGSLGIMTPQRRLYDGDRVDPAVLEEFKDASTVIGVNVV